MAAHTSSIRSLLGQQLQHWSEDVTNAFAFLYRKVVFLFEDVWQRPVAEAVDVAKLAFAVEDLLRPFAGETKRFGEGPEELDDLGDVVVVFTVLCAGLGIEEVVTCN